MVMDVSAILVANTILRTPTGGLCNKVYENSQLKQKLHCHWEACAQAESGHCECKCRE